MRARVEQGVRIQRQTKPYEAITRGRSAIKVFRHLSFVLKISQKEPAQMLPLVLPAKTTN